MSATTGEATPTVVGQEAHIRSSRKGGPRHEDDYPREKLDTYENLLLLCPTDHVKVDANNGAGYTVDDLERMRAAHEQRQDQMRIDEVVRAYMGVQFGRDDAILFEQVDLNGPSVDAMFIDVPFSCRVEDEPADLMRQIAAEHPGDETQRSTAEVVTGAAQALLHPAWRSHALVVGGPGQGKSTLLQFVCQFHRARLLSKENYSGEEQRLPRGATTPRTTFRVDLRDYAFWASEKQRDQAKKSRSGKNKRSAKDSAPWPLLEEYIAHDVKRLTARAFDVEDLTTILATRAVLLGLDGLDEVADTRHREQVSEQIVDLQGRQEPNARDFVILVASRPGTTTSRLWSSPMFPRMSLRRLTHGLQVQYLQRWCSVAGLDAPAVEKLQRTFTKNEHLPHFRELAAYPMQLAILLHLLQRRQLLPQQRTALYKEYLQTFLDREQGANKEPLLARERQVIEDVHARIAWHIQTESEQGRSSGSIKRSDLQRLVRDHLADREDGGKLGKNLFTAVTTRVLCLIEREEGWFQFEVASLREYFTALYMFDEVGRDQRDACLEALLRRPYWSNVCRFMVGMYNKAEVRGIRTLLEEMSTEPDLGAHPMLRSTATLLLNDGVYQGQKARPLQEIVDFVLSGPGVVFAEEGLLDGAGASLTLSEGFGRTQVAQHATRRLEQAPEASERLALAAVLARHTADAALLADWWWRQFQVDFNWLEIGSAMGTFADLSREREAQLLSARRTVNDDTTWFTDLLHRGGYSGERDDVIDIVKREINEGAAHVVAVRDGSSSIGRMLRRAQVSQLQKATVPGARTRLRRRDGVVSLVEILRATDGLTAPAPKSSASEWKAFLETVSLAWGAGWVLHQAIAGAPTSLDLRRVGSQSAETHPDLTASLAFECAVRDHRDDAAWWSQALDDAASDLMRRRWIGALVTRANTPVVVTLSGRLSAEADRLNPRHYDVVASSVRTIRGRGACRSLLLDDTFRRNKGDFSPRALWLCRIVASESSLERLGERLLPDLIALFQGAPNEALHHALPGRFVPPERVPSKSKAPRAPNDLGVPKVAAILADPSSWLPEYVQQAAMKVEQRMLADLDPVGFLATRDRWFEGTT